MKSIKPFFVTAVIGLAVGFSAVPVYNVLCTPVETAKPREPEPVAKTVQPVLPEEETPEVTLPEEPEVKDGEPVGVVVSDGDPEPVDAVTPEEPAPEKPQRVATVYDEPLNLIGTPGNAKVNRDKYLALVKRMIEQGEFEDFYTGLTGKIAQVAPELISSGKLRYHNYSHSDTLVESVDTCLLVAMVGQEALQAIAKPDSKKQGELLNEKQGEQFLYWLMQDKSRPLHQLLQAFYANEGREGNMGYSVELLYNLWMDTPPKEREKYLKLALACVLVDKGVAESGGLLRDISEPYLGMREVYAYYREMDAARKLATDIKKLSVNQLVYVVSSRLPRSEYDWVIKNIKCSQEKWGATYESVPYLMDRATHGKDPYKHYTFSEIRKEGGICMDRAYYASNTARCAGIPAVSIVGDGNLGPHAWVATLVDNVTWRQSGSYGYNTGRFTNPCSLKRLHEAVLLTQTSKTTPEKLAPAYDAMILTDIYNRMERWDIALSIAKYTTTAFPLLTAAWNMRVAAMLKDADNVPDPRTWRRLVTELNFKGRKNSELLDLAMEIEQNYALEGKSDAAKRVAMKRSNRKISKQLGDERRDLLLEAVQREADLYVENMDIRNLTALYNKQLKAHGNRKDVFDGLLGQYIGNLRQVTEDKRTWASAAANMEKLFVKHCLTGGDYFTINKETGIFHKIADAYVCGGNERKADKIRKEADERLKKARGKAPKD